MTNDAVAFIQGAQPGGQFTFGMGLLALARELEGYGVIERTGQMGVAGPIYRFTRKVARYQHAN